MELTKGLEPSQACVRSRGPPLGDVSTDCVRDPGIEPGLISDPNRVGRLLPMSLVGVERLGPPALGL